MGTTNQQSESAYHQARAKIMWGEPVEDAIAVMEENGFCYQEALSHVNNFLSERAADVRRQGVVDLLKGTGLLAVGTAGTLFINYMRVQDGRAYAVPLFIVLYGVFKLAKGVERIVFGSKIDGSIANIE
jgi:hypothetical protein